MKRFVPDGVRNAGANLFAAIYDRLEASSRERTFNRLRADGSLTVGVGTYGTPSICDLRGRERHRITIGNYCSIGPGVVMFLGGEHRPDFVSTFPFHTLYAWPGPNADAMPFGHGDIVIGHDVWLGHGAFISSGVTIGTGAIVGANAVVRGNVEPYSIVQGNPARPVKMRFSAEQIAGLLASRWWEWNTDKLRAHVDLISSPNVDEFLRRAGQS